MRKLLLLLFFFLGLTALRSRLPRLASSPLAYLVFSCSNFAKENKGLLAVYITYCATTTNILKTKTESLN